MKFQLKAQTLEQAFSEKSDALLLLLPKTASRSSITKEIESRIQTALANGDFENKAAKTLVLYGVPGIASRVVVVISAGEGSARNVRDAIAAGMAVVKTCSVKKLSLAVCDAAHLAYLPLAMQAIAQATYVYTTTKGTASHDRTGRQLALVNLYVNSGSSTKALSKAKTTAQANGAAKAQAAFAHGQALVAAEEFAKEWANRPANFATPTLLGQAAQSLCKRPSPVTCEVLGPKEVAKLGMGSFLSVGRGSDEPLRLIVLKYVGAPKAQAPQVLVGKGVTFDTGGISLKGGAGMDEMKFDMCGAASVLGVFRALTDLKLKLNVIGIIAATENMPSGHATKPGDVVVAMDGQTIEVLNTDAEGRLILNDALIYAKRFKPASVVDIATLTGACGVALGAVRAGLFSSDDALADELLAAGERALDLAWRMPLDDDYAEGLKSNFADVANVATTGGGAVVAAKFLERFTKIDSTGGEAAFPWAHLDIAGVAWRGGKDKGASARPVGLLLEWLLAKAASQ